MTRYEELENRIEALEQCIDELLGRQRGPITMREYRIACERKDKATMRAYLRQWENTQSFSPGMMEGEFSRDSGEPRDLDTAGIRG